MATRKRQSTTLEPRKKGSGGPPGAIVRKLRADLGLSQLLMARLADVSVRTLARLEAEETDTPRSFLELRRLVQALAQVMRPEFIAEWLQEPNDGFQGLKPIEVIERGEIDRVWEMLYRVGSGEPT